MKIMARLVVQATLVVLSMATDAAAQDYWLTVEPASPALATEVRATLWSGERLRGQRASAVVPTVMHVGLQSAQGYQDLLPYLGQNAQPFLKIQGKKLSAGSSLLFMDLRPADKDFAELDSYLVAERLYAVRRNSKGLDTSKHVRVVRFFKTVLQVGPEQTPVVTRPVGQELEIVPLDHPAEVHAGNLLAVQVLFRGTPIVERDVIAVALEQFPPNEQVRSTDAQGKVVFSMRAPGWWLIHLAHLEVPQKIYSEWQIYESNLSLLIQ